MKPGGGDNIACLYKPSGLYKEIASQFPDEDVGGVGASITKYNQSTEANVAKAYNFHTRRGQYGLNKKATMLLLYPDKSHTASWGSGQMAEGKELQTWTEMGNHG